MELPSSVLRALRLAGGLLLSARLPLSRRLLAPGLLLAAVAGFLLARLLAVGLAPIVGDVEARSLEQKSRAARGNAHRAAAALRTTLRGIVGDAVEQLEQVLAAAAPIVVRRHRFSVSLECRWSRRE